MKPFLLLGALLCSHVHAAVEGEGYQNFVRQTQQTTGVVWSMPVAPNGAAASQGMMETGGSLFQLWTIETLTAKEYLLDQKLVGAYLPTASVKVTTLDPYTLRARTRADKPFTVTVNVAGLLTGTGLPEAAKRVLLEHHVAKYTATQTSLTPAQATSGTPKSSSSVYANGNTVLNFAATNITGADPTKVSGEEHFVVHALSDGTFTQTQIASGNVQVWPVTSGSIAGIAASAVIRSAAPTLTVTMTDLYPSSDTYVQVYKGNPVLNFTGTRLVGSTKVLDQASSESKVLTVSNYDSVFPTDGTYTMELLTKTPFGTDRLYYVTFSVNRTLEIRGQLGGLEAE